jgi:thioredoxin-like negative regulator of GroEL
MRRLDDLEALRAETRGPGLRVIFVSQPDCAICTALLPKVEAAVEAHPPATLAYVDASVVTEVASELSVLTVPVVAVFLDGHEVHRQARFVRLAELESGLARFAEAAGDA